MSLDRGIAALKAGNGEEALAWFEQMLAANPSALEPAYYRAVALAKLGRAQDAMEAARAALRTHVGEPSLIALIERLEPSSGGGGGGGRAHQASPLDLRPGDVLLDTYRVEELVGRGGMGRVFRVRHREWDIPLAMKVPLAALLSDRAATEAFAREAETWVSLEPHPNVVTCHYVRTIDGVPCVFAEFVADGSLADWIADGRLVARQDALAWMLDIAIQFAYGLAVAHDAKLVHQDVKPQNVMIASDTVKVTDFGLARGAAAGASLRRLTTTKSFDVTGGAMTPAYCSPEQAAGARVSQRTDVWSWAVSILEMFVGARTWSSGPAAPEVLAAYLTRGKTGVPPSDNRPAMPPSVAELLLRCLAKDAAQRPNDMRDIARTLEGIYASVVGRAFSRRDEGGKDVRADSLNNRAMSLLDLGRSAAAEQLLTRALAIDPRHIQASFNSAALRWRDGRATDADVVKSVRDAHSAYRDRWEGAYYLGLIEEQRGAHREAAEALDTARLGDSEALLRIDGEKRSSGRATEKREFAAPDEFFFAEDVAMSADAATIVVAFKEGHLSWFGPRREAIHRRGAHVEGKLRVALTTDGTFALSGGADGRIVLWRANQDEPVATLTVDGPVTGLALAADQTWFACASLYGRISIFDSTSRRLLRQFQSVRAPAIAAGLRVLLCHGEGQLQLIDVGTGSPIRTLALSHSSSGIAITADDRLALSVGWDGALRVFTTTDGECVLERTIADQRGVQCTRDGRYAVTGSGESGTGSVVRLWDLQHGRCLHTFDVTIAGSHVAISADGRSVAHVGHRWCHHWTLSSHAEGELPVAFALPRAATQVVQEQKRGRALIEKAREQLARGDTAAALESASGVRNIPGFERANETLALWDDLAPSTARGTFRAAWCTFEVAGVHSPAIAPNGSFFLVCGYAESTPRDGADVIEMLDSRSGARIRRLAAGRHRDDVALIGADGALAIVTSGSRLEIWQTATGAQVGFVDVGAKVSEVAVTIDGRFAVVSDERGDIGVWALPAGHCVQRISAYEGASSVALTPDASLIFSGGDKKGIDVWDRDSGRRVRRLEGHTDRARAFAISADGRHLLSGSSDGQLRLWEIATGRCVHVLTGHSSYVCAVALSADGLVAVSGGASDHAIRIWDLRTGACVQTLEGHADWVVKLSLAMGGHVGLSWSRGGIVRGWRFDWNLLAAPRSPADMGGGAARRAPLPVVLHPQPLARVAASVPHPPARGTAARASSSAIATALVLVDGDARFAERMRDELEKTGCTVHVASDRVDAISIMRRTPVDLVVIGIEGDTNIYGVNRVRRIAGRARMLAVSRKLDRKPIQRHREMATRADDYLERADVAAIVRRALDLVKSPQSRYPGHAVHGAQATIAELERLADDATGSREADLLVRAAVIAHTTLSDFDSAKELYAMAIEAHPLHEDAARELLAIHRTLLDWAPFVAHAEAMIDRGVLKRVALAEKAKVLEEQFLRADVAASDYRKLTELDRDDASAWEGLFRCLRYLQEWSDLTTALQQRAACTRDPEERRRCLQEIARLS